MAATMTAGPDRAHARRLLVVSWPYPPVPSVGGNRWLAISKYMRRRGHEVTVITTGMFGARADDGAEGVMRTRDLAGMAWLRRALRRPMLREAAGPGLPADTRPAAALTKLVVPDAWLVSWVPFAFALARRVVRERAIDCVITTTPYESAHVIPLLLGRDRPAWIADFRDGWSFEPHREPFPTRAQRAADLRLERTVVTSADRVLGATLPIVEDFRDRLGVDAVHVPNGWDPELAPGEEVAAAPQLDSARVTLLHTGTLSGGWGRDPRPLLEALQELAADRPSLAERLRLMLVGRMTTEQQALLRRFRLDGLVQVTGHLPRDATLSLQRRASALLLLTAPGNRGEATGKLFEYLGAGRPILALAAGNEAARIVATTGTGVVVPPDDRRAIRAALERLAAGDLQHDYEPRGLEPYVYPSPALAVEREVEAAIGRRATA